MSGTQLKIAIFSKVYSVENQTHANVLKQISHIQ